MRRNSLLSLALATLASFGTTVADPYAAAAGAISTPHAALATLLSVPAQKRQSQIPIQVCPEDLGGEPKSCNDCGGDSTKAGICNNLLRSGDQTNCGPIGCGVYCKCTPPEGPIIPPGGQIPIQVCPEELKGGSKKKCSDCGGEDPNAPGMCKDILSSGDQAHCPSQGCGYQCKCDNGSGEPEETSTTLNSDSPATSTPDPSAPSGETQVTTVVDGQTVTATFGVTTLSEWKDIRSHTVITTTTEKDGKETEIAAAIFVGGIAWWLFGQSGVVGAGAMIQPPNSKPNDETKDDDEKCSPEPKCPADDCGGANDLGLCKSGDKQNCPCQDEKCPEERPECDAKDCEGDDKLQCQSEKLQGCQCCPKETECSAEDCEGKDGKCTNEKLKNCACSSMPTNQMPDGTPANEVDINAAREIAEKIFKEVFESNEKLLNGEDFLKAPAESLSPTCNQPSGETYGIAPEDASAIAEKWCGLDFGSDREDDMGGDHIDKKDIKNWLHLTYKHADGKCSQSCKDITGQMIKRCQYNSHSYTAKATLETECGTYSVETRGNAESAPAPAPEPAQPDRKYEPGTCSALVNTVSGSSTKIRVQPMRDNTGKELPSMSQGYSPAQDEAHKIVVTSYLPADFYAWGRPNGGWEFRYGDQSWNTNKEYYDAADDVVPRIRVRVDEDDGSDPQNELLRIGVIQVYFHCD